MNSGLNTGERRSELEARTKKFTLKAAQKQMRNMKKKWKARKDRLMSKSSRMTKLKAEEQYLKKGKKKGWKCFWIVEIRAFGLKAHTSAKTRKEKNIYIYNMMIQHSKAAKYGQR